MAAEFAIPSDRIFVAGLSAGGAMAAILGEAYPDLYAAVGVHSGLARGAASDVRSAFAAMRRAPALGAPRPAGRTPRVIVFHGGADATVHPSNAAEIVARASAGIPGVTTEPAAAGSDGARRSITRRADGTAAVELWLIDGAGHAWSGGQPAGTYTDPSGPDASAEMVRFFLEA